MVIITDPGISRAQTDKDNSLCNMERDSNNTTITKRMPPKRVRVEIDGLVLQLERCKEGGVGEKEKPGRGWDCFWSFT